MDEETQRLRRLVFGEKHEAALRSAASLAAGADVDTAYLRKLQVRDLALSRSAQPAQPPTFSKPVVQPPAELPGLQKPIDDVRRLREEVQKRTTANASVLEKDLAKNEATAVLRRISRVEVQLLEKLEFHKQKRDAALRQPGGEQIAASYQREIEADELRLAAFKRSEGHLKR